MNLGELRKAIEGLPDKTRFLVSSDEELNCMFDKWEVATLSDKKDTAVIYGLSGSELEHIRTWNQ